MNNDTRLIISTNKAILTITLNNPSKHNALDNTLIKKLLSIFHQADNDENIRVILLTANGDNFCAGADISWMKQMVNTSYGENLADALILTNLLQQMHHFSKPIIALVHGRVYGGGLGILACCDIVLSCQSAQYCFSEVKLGIIPATIAPYVVHKIGASAAKQLILTAKLFSAEKAKSIGLIHKIVDNRDALVSTGTKTANALLNNGPKAMALTKKLINDLSPIEQSLIEKTANLLANIRTSPEGQEGLTAFLQKRQPNWMNNE